MSIKVSPNLPANVVEIGQELAQATLDGINNAASPSAGNPMITQSALSGQISGFITGISWGDITGTITNQSDLTTYISDFGYLTDAQGSIDHDSVAYARANGGWTSISQFPEAPSDGQEYVRKDAAWSVATGGGGGTWDGGTVNNTITVIDPIYTQNNTVVGQGYIEVASDSHSTVQIGSGAVYGVEAINFADSTSQSTAFSDAPSDGSQYVRKDAAWVLNNGTANLGDIFAMSIVKDVSWTGSSWNITCDPVNPHLASNGGMAILNADGSHFEWMSGMSSSTTWTFTTSSLTFSFEPIYIQCYGQKSQNPLNS